MAGFPLSFIVQIRYEMLTKYASLEEAEVLEVKSSGNRVKNASLNKMGEFDDYHTEDGYLYARIRAISSRVNKNHDGWPTAELAGGQEPWERISSQREASEGGFTVESSKDDEYGFSTFLGKPIFVDHNNSNPDRARGVIVDSKFNVLDQKTSAKDDKYWNSDTVDPEHLPPTEVELLLEVDAKSFPKLAKAIVNGDIDGFSMGCFVPGTPITLADGTQKPIETIEIGDEVLTHTGKTEPVTYVMKRPHKGVVYDVKTYGQSVPMVLTEEHPVWTENGWVEAKDLEVGDFVLSPTVEGVGHPGSYPFARLLGYYLAEGNLGYDRKRFADGRPVFVEWSFNVDEIEYIEEIKTLLSAIGYNSAGPYVKNSCASIRCNSPELAQRFLDYGSQHSWNKQLHPEVLSWEPDNQRGLLRAYFNGDGHYRNDGQRVEAGTASQKLAQQLQLIATRVGIKMTPPVKQHSPSAVAVGSRPKYSMQAVLEPTEDSRSQNHYGAHLDEQGLWRRISSISIKEYEGNVYNFDVEGDDSYVAADVAVHNCDVDYSKCSHCGHEASTPDEYCSHIQMKGAEHDFKTADGQRTSRKSYENCYGIKFFEISAVFDPADETALAKEVRHEGSKMSYLASKIAEAPEPQEFHTKAPQDVDTHREEKICPLCGSDMEGEKCDVCGYDEPPSSLQNPDLMQAQETDLTQQDQDQVTIPADETVPPPADGQGESFLDAKNNPNTASVISEMRWAPKIKIEASGPKGDEPDEIVTSDQDTPVTATFRTAQDMIQAAKRNQKENNMSDQTKVAADPADQSGKAKKQVDVNGVGGVDEASAEAASKADFQVDPEGKGGINGDNKSTSAPDEKSSLPSGEQDNAGFQPGGQKGPDTQTFPNTNEPDSAVTDKAFPTAANHGTQPADPVGKAKDRIDVETPPHDRVGPDTQTWSGTSGNGVTRQQEPVTDKVFVGDGAKSGHVSLAALKLADTEVELGLIEKEDKYNRLAELDEQTEEEIAAAQAALSKVKTAGFSRTGGVGRLPSFKRIASEEAPEPQLIDDGVLDSALYSR